jgi:hypothetical protein
VEIHSFFHTSRPILKALTFQWSRAAEIGGVIPYIKHALHWFPAAPLKPILTNLAAHSARDAAAELNRRNVETPTVVGPDRLPSPRKIGCIVIGQNRWIDLCPPKTQAPVELGRRPAAKTNSSLIKGPVASGRNEKKRGTRLSALFHFVTPRYRGHSSGTHPTDIDGRLILSPWLPSPLHRPAMRVWLCPFLHPPTTP